MHIKRTNKSDTAVVLSVSADEQFLANVKQVVLTHLAAKHVKVPGFRAGKVPLALVEKSADPNLLQSEFAEEAINRLYPQVIQAEKLRPIAQPEITLKKYVPFTTLEVDITVEVIGDITLPNYKTIKKTSPKVSVTTKDVDDVVSSLRARMAEKKEVKRASKDGDEVIIDFAGTDSKGKAVAGADGRDYPLVLGSNSFIPGFESNLVGMKAGEEKSFDVTFPKDYGVAALQNKKVTFKVTVKSVHERTEPKLDDAFASKAGPFKELADLKADIKKQLVYEREAEAKKAFQNELVNEIAQKSKVAIPERLIDEQVLRGEEEEKRNITYRGQTWQEHLAEEGITEEEHRKKNRPAAEQTIRASLVLSEIAEREKIGITPEELEIRIQILKGQYNSDQGMQAELDKPEARRDIENRLMTEKTLDKLVAYATGEK